MAGQPWMKWFVGDWKREPRVRPLSAEARGVWLEILMFMHEEETYRMTGTVEHLADLATVKADEMRRALRELADHGVADIRTERTGGSSVVTVLSRRRAKEYKSKQDARIRQRKRRNQPLPEDLDQFLINYPSRSGHGLVTDTHALARADSDSDSEERVGKKVKKGRDGSPRARGSGGDPVALFTDLTGYDPPVFFADQIAHVVKRLDVWEAVVQRWIDSDYRVQNVSGILDLYRAEVQPKGTAPSQAGPGSKRGDAPLVNPHAIAKLAGTG